MKPTKSRAWYKAVEKELALQARQRDRITEAERKLAWWRQEHMTVLQRGGKGWTLRIGRANMQIDHWWNELRRRILIFNRHDVPEIV